MYNEDLKLAFLAHRGSKPTTERSERSILESVADMEREKGSDICTWGFEDAQKAINQVSRLRRESQSRQLQVFQEYVKWCIESGVPGACDGMLKVKGANLNRMREILVADPADLQRCLNDVFPPESTEDITSTYRCYFWCGFAGVDEKDIFELTAKNLDFNSRKIRIGKQVYPLYEESIPAFYNAVHLTDFHTTDERVRSSRKPRAEGVCIMRGMKGVPKITTFRVMMSRAFGKDGVRELSYKRVRMSGLFYETRMAELQGLPPSFAMAAAEIVSPRAGEVRLKRGITERELLLDYNKWKEAFPIE